MAYVIFIYTALCNEVIFSRVFFVFFFVLQITPQLLFLFVHPLKNMKLLHLYYYANFQEKKIVFVFMNLNIYHHNFISGCNFCTQLLSLIIFCFFLLRLWLDLFTKLSTIKITKLFFYSSPWSKILTTIQLCFNFIN